MFVRVVIVCGGVCVSEYIEKTLLFPPDMSREIQLRFVNHSEFVISSIPNCTSQPICVSSSWEISTPEERRES